MTGRMTNPEQTGPLAQHQTAADPGIRNETCGELWIYY